MTFLARHIYKSAYCQTIMTLLTLWKRNDWSMLFRPQFFSHHVVTTKTKHRISVDFVGQVLVYLVLSRNQWWLPKERALNKNLLLLDLITVLCIFAESSHAPLGVSRPKAPITCNDWLIFPGSDDKLKFGLSTLLLILIIFAEFKVAVCVLDMILIGSPDLIIWGLHFRGKVNAHAEAENAAFAHARWCHLYLSFALLYDRLDYREAQTYALMVHVCRSVQLAESREQLWNVIWCDTTTSVLHLSIQVTICAIVREQNFDEASCGELDRVLDQID